MSTSFHFDADFFKHSATNAFPSPNLPMRPAFLSVRLSASIGNFVAKEILHGL